MNLPRYEILEHTADIAIKIIAQNYISLFEYAPVALYSVIGDIVIDKNIETKRETITLKADSWEELLHDWLTEILYYFEVRELIVKQCNFSVLKPEYLESDLKLGKIDIRKSKISREIKAITYHNLKIEQKDNLIEANVILDI